MAEDEALAARLAEALAALGKTGFRAGQEEAVRSALAGEDSLVLLPTGGGKSLCYMLPAMLQPGLCVVVSPLRALMRDQVASMEKVMPRGTVAALMSDTPEAERQQIYAQLEGRAPLKLKILLVTPELLDKNARVAAALARLVRAGLLSLFAVDESHTVTDWGSTFRPGYRKLHVSLNRLALPRRPPVMALTASATIADREAIAKSLRLHEPHLVVTSLNRRNIRYEVRYPDAWPAGSSADNRDSDLLALLCAPDALGEPLRCGVVYCRKREECNRVAAMLCAAGVKAAAYHAGMTSPAREATQKRWGDGRNAVVVSTIAFGMGIDKADVRLVVHFDPPMSLTNLYQESGRAGRDGRPALSVVYYWHAAETNMQWLSTQPNKQTGAASKKAMHASIRALRCVMAAYHSGACMRAAVMCHFGETLPRGACRAAGSAGCTACSDPSATIAAIATMSLETTGDRDQLKRYRAAIAQGPAGVHKLDKELEQFSFDPICDDELSGSGCGSSDDEDGDAQHAADVALAGAAAAGGDSERRVAGAMDALEDAEEKAGGGDSGRRGMAADIFSHRPASAARPAPAAARGPLKPAPAPARAVDAALRSETLAKLTAALGGDAAAAAAKEGCVFAGCRGVRSMYDTAAKGALLDAQRAASGTKPAGALRVPQSTRMGAFVPPRAAQTQPAQPAAAAKLKSTRIGWPLPSETPAAQRPKLT